MITRQPKIDNLSTKALIELRKQIDAVLALKRQELENQISILAGLSRAGSSRRSLKGRKIAPKYRDGEGNTWAGRGARPKWLVAALKRGKKLDSFLVR